MNKGVDGFRYDMAEMVPVEFWSYMNSALKMKNPEVFLLAEVYNPGLYRDYIQKGKMDYLYDKVELYDTLKNIMQGHGSTDNIPAIYSGLVDIEHHMLHFLENHDEQRIASKDFAGSAEKGKPAMVVSTCLSTSPTMLYFGQNVGEPGDGDMGFGDETRTSIFDYCGVPTHQRWMNKGKFDGGQLTASEKELNNFYKTLLSFSAQSSALMGEYGEIHSYNRKNTDGYNNKIFSFIRWSNDEKLIIVSNFEKATHKFQLKLNSEIVKNWNLENIEYQLIDQLTGEDKFKLKLRDGAGIIDIEIKDLEAFVLKL
jgi:glycosidase